MGDRCLIQLTSGKDFSPVLYLHWMGHRAPSLLDDFAHKFLRERGDDLEYGFARLVQYACIASGIDEVTGVGVMQATGILTADKSHGDAGVMVADLQTREVHYAGGYKPVPEGEAWSWRAMP